VKPAGLVAGAIPALVAIASAALRARRSAAGVAAPIGDGAS
jgi:hypothetical protein